jgi:hypothetical protein
MLEKAATDWNGVIKFFSRNLKGLLFNLANFFAAAENKQ